MAMEFDASGLPGSNGAQPTDRTVTLAADTTTPQSSTPHTVTIALEAGDIVHLPAGTDISHMVQVGNDLEFTQPDGTVIVIPNGAVADLTIFVGNVEIPADTVAALYQSNDIHPAEGGNSNNQHAHGNFSHNPGGIGDAFGLTPLLGPTSLAFESGEQPPLDFQNTAPRFVDADGRDIDDWQMLSVSEEGLPSGNKDSTGTPDTTDSAMVNNGVFYVIDPDGTPLTFSLGEPSEPLTSHGVPITWTGVNTDTLVGWAGADKIITITFSDGAQADGKGRYDVVLSGPLDDPNPHIEDDVTISFKVTVDDGQGGTDTATFKLNVEDDSPVVAAHEAGGNLIVNGQFNDGTFVDLSGWAGQAAKGSIPGWTIDGPQLERNPSGWYVNSDPYGGGKVVDLDASPGDVKITQTVTGLTDGEHYILTFDAAKPAGFSAEMNVYWNGNLVGTVDPTASSFSSYTFDLVAAGTTGTLSFAEVGNPDNGGTFLANVELRDAAGFVNEDGLANGNPGGPGDVAEAGTVASAALGISWGADNYDLADSNGVQDGANSPGGLTGRALFFADAAATAMVGSTAVALTSGTEAVQFQLVANGTELVGYTGTFSAESNSNWVFTVTLSDDGTGSYTFTLLKPLDHPIANTEDDLALSFNATARDADGDTAATGFTVSVNDDSPTVTASVAALADGLDFGSFTPNGNAWGQGSGTATGTNGGWTIAGSGTANDGNGTVQLERVGDGYDGMHSSTHGYMVDLDASPHDIEISQTITGLTAGETTVLHFEAGVPVGGTGTLEVWFGGQLVETIDPTTKGVMTGYSIALTGGFGNGSNLLEFREVGTPDNVGTYLANVSVGGIIIDETAGIQGDSSEVAALSIFDSVFNPGSGMPAQYAQGSGPAVAVDAKYGADGPAASNALVYALSVTNGADSGLQTTDGHEIYLYNENGLVVGRYESDGSAGITIGDKAAFAFQLDSTTGVISMVQYVSLHNGDTTNPNDTVQLAAGSLNVNVTVTDGDGDTAHTTVDVSQEIQFRDDGPTLTASGSELPTLTVDESFLAANIDNPDAGSHQDPTGSTTSSASFTGLFDVSFGADGPQGAAASTAVSYALGLTGATTTVDSVTGVDSGVKDTQTGHEVMLNLVNGVIEGTVFDGTAYRTVFTITGSTDGTVTLEQDRAVVHDDPSDPDQAGDPTVLHLPSGASITLTATATDGDGDQASQAVNVSGAFAFKDDGPTLTVTVHDAVGTNLITNGSFEIVTPGGEPGAPITEQSGWELYSSIPGWTTLDGVPLEIQQDQNSGSDVSGVKAQDGVNVTELDSDSVGNDPGQDENSTDHTNVTLQQTVATVAGQSYELSFYEQPRPNIPSASTTFTVQFGGTTVNLTAVGDPDANGWQHYTATVTATSASTVLSFIGTGTEDSWGALLDNVSLVATTAPVIVIDETPTTPQAGTNETTAAAVIGLFDGIVSNPGVDPDMAPQYATGSADVLDVNVDFGADGPATKAATAYALTLGSAGQNSLVDSGLETTDGREIYLFKEGDLIVGRYDAPDDGNTTVNSSDPAAFAIAIDPATGVVSIAQYVSLNNPITTDPNDPVFLNAGALSVTVTVTDGDGDSVSKSANIGALIQFDDDGPTLVANASTTATVNEANIFDLWSQGTDPDFLAHTDVLGAAYTTGSLSSLVNFGADGAGSFSFTATATTQLEALHLTSNGQALSYAIVNGVLVGYVDHGQPGPSLDDRPVFALTLTANGSYDFELFSQLDHDKPTSGADTNTTLQDNGQNSATDAIDFGQIIQATDGDGDSITLGGAFKVTIVDDVPQVSLVANPVAYVGVDESAGSQDGGSFLGVALPPNDTTDSTVRGYFAAFEATNASQLGNDTDIAHAVAGSPAIAYAHGATPVVIPVINGGADGVASAVYALQAASAGVYSGVQTTDGQNIYLYEDATGLIVGRVGGSDAANPNGTIAFAIGIEQNGDIDIAQYLSLKELNTSSSNDIVSLADGALQAVITVTDGDGDVASSTASIGSHIVFYDDGPTLSIDATRSSSVLGGLDATLDETVGTDHYSSTDNVSRDTDVNGGPNSDDVTGTLAQRTTALSGSGLLGLFNVNENAGADGVGSQSFQLSFTGLSSTTVGSGTDAVANWNKGITTNLSATHTSTTAGGAIELFLDSAVNAAGSHDIVGYDAAGNLALRIAIVDVSGEPQLQTTLYEALDNGNDNNQFDSSLTLALTGRGASIGLTYAGSLTDGDGDTASDSATVTLINSSSHSNPGYFTFQDDGPTISGVTGTLGPNLVQNGSFEEGLSTVPGGWQIYDSLTGWQLPGGVPVEVQTGAGGLPAEDGTNLIELDSDLKGNGSGGTNTTGHTNVTIAQTITTVIGQTYELSFWASPRPGHEGSSGMTVSFGGSTVQTLTPDSSTPDGWQHYTVEMTATSTSSVLSFTGTGAEDSFGELLDNVSLKAVNALDDEDIGSKGLQGGPGDDGSGVVAAGQVAFNAGADGLKSIAIGTAIQVTNSMGDTASALSAIYIDTNGVGTPEALKEVWVADTVNGGGTLYGVSAANGGHFTQGHPAFALQIAADGTYTFTLDAPLDHPFTTAANTAAAGSEYEDNLLLNFGVTVTDGDNDTANATITIDVDDDTPVITGTLQGGGLENLTVGPSNDAEGQWTAAFGADGRNAGDGVHIDVNGTNSAGQTFTTATTSMGSNDGHAIYEVTVTDSSNATLYSFYEYQTYDAETGTATMHAFSSLTAAEAAAGSQTASDGAYFDLTANASTGIYDFDLLHNIAASPPTTVLVPTTESASAEFDFGPSKSPGDTTNYSSSAYVVVGTNGGVATGASSAPAPGTYDLVVTGTKTSSHFDWSTFQWVTETDPTNVNATGDGAGHGLGIGNDNYGELTSSSNNGEHDKLNFAFGEQQASVTLHLDQGAEPLGHEVLTITISDGNGHSATKTFTQTEGTNVVVDPFSNATGWTGSTLSSFGGHFTSMTVENTASYGNDYAVAITGVDYTHAVDVEQTTPGSGVTGASELPFTLGITDGDGDSTSASFSVTLQTNSPPTISVTPATTPVDEAALSTGSHHDGYGVTVVSGTIHLSATDGIQSLKVVSDTRNQFQGTFGSGTTITQGANYGTLTITGYDPVSGNATYTYTLTNPVHDTTPNNGADVVSPGDTFSLTVTDNNGAQSSTNLVIDIKDDVPVLGTIDTLQVNGNDTTLHHEGIAFTAGADGVGGGSLAGNTAPAGLMSAGQAVSYWISTDGHELIGYIGNPPTGNAQPSNQVFTLTLDASDQGYSYQQLQAFDSMTTTVDPLGSSDLHYDNQPAGEVDVTYDGGTIAKVTGSDGHHTDVNGSADGFGIHSNGFTPGDDLNFDFKQYDTGTATSSVTFSFTKDGSVDYVVHYSDGSSSTMTNQAVTDHGTLVFTAPSGATIDSVEFTGDSGTPNGGFKIVLDGATVETTTVLPPNDLAFNVALTDGDGDQVTGTINVDVHTPPPALVAALDDDTGSSSSDGITKDGQIDVSGIVSGDTWQYSTDGGSTWHTGTGSSFTLAPGSYAANAIQVSQTDSTGDVSDVTKLGAITVDTTPPMVQSITLGDYSLHGGQNTTVTITFSEAVAGFDNSDVSVQSGSLGTVSSSDGGKTWVATFTASNKNDSSNVISVGHNYTDIAGNAGSSGQSSNYTVSKSFPAGVSGQPINLALSNVVPADHIGDIALLIAGVPEGWTLSQGTKNADGSWSLTTSDLSSLTVTSPAGVTGALVLDVTASWTNADGSSGTAYVADNVEAYAAGDPIFAWSGDDNLSASSGDDMLVFANMIGTDVVHNFDVAHDTIDLVGFGFSSFADVLAHLSADAAGNAVITLGTGETITLTGVDAGTLTADDFVFDQTAVTHNAATMTLGDGALLPLSGVVDNTGTIALGDGTGGASLEIVEHGAMLQGGGTILMSDSADNVIFGSDAGVTLTNVDNTISGAGQIGDGQLGFVNEGTVIATGEHALTIDASGTISNTGTFEATGSGGLVVDDALVNDGLLWANGGDLDFEGDVSGSGHLKVDGAARVEIGGSFSENIALGADADATIVIDHAAGFTGSIAGLDGNDTLAFGDISSANATVSYMENAEGTGGALTISDGTHTAQIALDGDYDASGFHLSGGNDGGSVLDYAGVDWDNVVLPTTGQSGETLQGTDGADKFTLTDAHAVDFIADYNFEQGDTVDLSALLGHGSGAPVPTAANAADFVHYDDTSGTLSVDVTGSGHDFVDVAVLNHPVPDVKVILDDGVDVTVNHLG